MNPLTNVKNLNKLNQRELELGLRAKKSWHDKYKDSAWIFVGGLPYDLTEGDILCIFSQYGEIVNINLVRDQKTGKQKGFCFLCYEDQRSTILAVDNFNGAKVLGRVMRVDHVEEYRKPKDHGDEDDLTKKIRTEGCAPRIASSPEPEEDLLPLKKKKDKKTKKEKKEKKKKKKAKQKQSSSDESSESDQNERVKKKQKINKGSEENVRVKKEKYDSGYDKALKGDIPGTRQQFSESDSDQDGHVKYPRNDRNSESRNLEFSNRDKTRDRIDYRKRDTDNSYSDRQRDDVSYSRQRETNDRFRESDYRSRDADSRRDYDSRQGQRSNRDEERSNWDLDRGRDRGRDIDRGQGERSNRGQDRDYDRRGSRYDERNDRSSGRDKYKEERRNERSSSLDRRGNRDRSYDTNGDRDRRR